MDNMFWVTFEGRMLSLRGDWVPCRITEMVSEPKLIDTVRFFTVGNHYRGEITEIARAIRRK